MMSVYLCKEPVMVTSKLNEGLYVLIFKTNIQSEDDLKTIDPCLSDLHSIISWHIDREDIDNVLRIESINDNTQYIIDCVNKAGFFCEELD